MPKIGNLSVSMGIEISEETVRRCCQILQMYLDDNPDKTITSGWYMGSDGEKHHTVYIDVIREETKDER